MAELTDETQRPPGIWVRTAPVRRRVWPLLSVLLGALLWWPAGFWGRQPWLHLPLQGMKGDLLLLGTIAAAASVSLVARSPWPRFVIVLVFSGLGWLIGPVEARYPDEREILVIILAVGAFLGVVLGARGSKGPLAAATVLAVVAGVSPASWPHGAPLAVALALPFTVATWQRVAPTVLSVARILLTWLVFGVLAMAVRSGWGVLHPKLGAGSKRGAIRLVAAAMADFLRTHWWGAAEGLLRGVAGWFWVALAIAVVIGTERALTAALSRRSAPAPGRS